MLGQDRTPHVPRLRGLVAAAKHALSPNRALLGNTLALTGTTLSTSVLGFLFWSVAARLFPPETVGRASAGVSAMTLLGTAGMFGLGTLMISELPQRRGERGPLLSAALLTSLVAASGLWAVAVGVGRATGVTAAGILALAAQPWFALGVALTAAGLVLDKATIGLLRGDLQLWRNLVFAAVKLGVLAVVGVTWASASETHVIASWTVGLVASFVVVVAILAWRGVRVAFVPSFALLRSLGGATMAHYALNLALFSPRLLLPVLAAVIVSADANAAFYAAWMLVGFVFMIPDHFSTVLHAVGSGDAERLARRLRFALRVSLPIAGLAGLALFVVAPLALGVFGAYYAETAVGSLRILTLAIPAMAIKLFIVAVARVRGRIARMALYMAVGGGLEVGLAAWGAARGGIAGLSIGFVVALAIQAAVAAPALLRATRDPEHGPAPEGG